MIIIIIMVIIIIIIIIIICGILIRISKVRSYENELKSNYRCCALYSSNGRCGECISYMRFTVCFAEHKAILDYPEIEALKSCVLSCFPTSYHRGGPLLDAWPTVLPCTVAADDDAVKSRPAYNFDTRRSLRYVLFCLPGKTDGLVQVRRVGQQIASCPSVCASVVVFLQLHQKGGVMVALLRVGHTRLAHGRLLPAPVRAFCGEPLIVLYIPVECHCKTAATLPCVFVLGNDHCSVPNGVAWMNGIGHSQSTFVFIVILSLKHCRPLF
jgi:hypothetical protein